MKKADLTRNMKKRGMWESGKAKGGPKRQRGKKKETMNNSNPNFT